MRAAQRDMRQEWERQQQLQQCLEHGIQEQIPEVRIQGAQVPRLPNTTNVAFAGVEGEALMMSLDLQGVALSTGSACSSGSLEPSHVLCAMGVPAAYLHGALRCSLGRGPRWLTSSMSCRSCPARAAGPRPCSLVCTVAVLDTGEKLCNIPTSSGHFEHPRTLAPSSLPMLRSGLEPGLRGRHASLFAH
jgi:hypothetical protein